MGKKAKKNEVRLEDVSQAIFGMTSRRYRQLAKDFSEKGKDKVYIPMPAAGKIDFPLATKGLIAYYRRVSEGGGTLSLTDARTKKEIAKAGQEEIKYQRMKESLADEAFNLAAPIILDAKKAFREFP